MLRERRSYRSSKAQIGKVGREVEKKLTRFFGQVRVPPALQPENALTPCLLTPCLQALEYLEGYKIHPASTVRNRVFIQSASRSPPGLAADHAKFYTTPYMFLRKMLNTEDGMLSFLGALLESFSHL